MYERSKMNVRSFLKFSYLVLVFTLFSYTLSAHAQLKTESLNETAPIERVIKGVKLSHPQQSVVYYWTDVNGTKHYTDKPQKSQKTTRRIVTIQEPMQPSIRSMHTPTQMMTPTHSSPPSFPLSSSATGPLTSDLPPPTSLPPQGLPPLPQDIEGVLRPESKKRLERNTLFLDVKSRVL